MQNKIPLTVLFLANGDVRNPLASSGTPANILRCLESLFEQAIPVNISLQGLARLINIVRAFSPSRERWKYRLDLNFAAFAQRSALAHTKVTNVQLPIGAVVQMGGMWSPPRVNNVPLFLWLDFTNAIARREFPDWVPFRSPRAAQRWFEAEREVYRRAAMIFVYSERVRRSLIEDYGVADTRIRVVGCGTNITSHTDLDKRYDGHTILFVGRDFHRKGGEILLKAFAKVRAQIPDARLQVVGPPPGSVGEQPGVEFLGWVSDREHLLRLFAEADVYAMPSLCEPFGQAFIEAMSFKLPCVGTDTGGVPDIIEEGVTGYMIPRGDTTALADRLITLLSDAQLCRRLGEAGLQKAHTAFQWSVVFAKVRAGMESTLETWEHEQRDVAA
ncbi:MAG: glycosyltransferase family 4 protein [Deltaproteobacteria bacterium]|nr:glycosyltransferase family 4 protein [Deltaproteobacteria bacterium]